MQPGSWTQEGVQLKIGGIMRQTKIKTKGRQGATMKLNPRGAATKAWRQNEQQKQGREEATRKLHLAPEWAKQESRQREEATKKLNPGGAATNAWQQDDPNKNHDKWKRGGNQEAEPKKGSNESLAPLAGFPTVVGFPQIREGGERSRKLYPKWATIKA
jgi:hypothetical protein